MWSVGLNRSKISVKSREHSVDLQEHSTSPTRSPHRLRNKRLCEHDHGGGGGEQEVGEVEKGRVKVRRGMSKSSVEEIGRRKKVEGREGSFGEREGRRIGEGEKMAVSDIKRCDSEEEERVEHPHEVKSRQKQGQFELKKVQTQPASQPKKSVTRTTATISTQTQYFPPSTVPSLALLSQLQQSQKTNSLYQLKLAELQIQYSNLKFNLFKELSKMKQEMSVVVEKVVSRLREQKEKEEKLRDMTGNYEGFAGGIVREIGDPQQYVANILKNVSKLKSAFKIQNKNDVKREISRDKDKFTGAKRSGKVQQQHTKK